MTAFPTGATPSDLVSVAYPDDLGRTYLYRPSELVVASRSEGLVADQLERFDPRVLRTLPHLDAVVFVLPSGVDIPLLLEELLAEDDRLQVSPNHIFWQTEKEEEEEVVAPARIRIPGFGLRGRLLDAARPDEPVYEPWMSSLGVRLVDRGIAGHALFSQITASKGGIAAPFDPYEPTVDSHATAVLGALLLETPITQVEIVDAAGADGLVDELTLAEALVQPGFDVTCVPLGGFTHHDRPPVLLSQALQRAGLLVVAAAGNHGSNRPFWPAALEGAVAVAALDEAGRIARWSGRGPWVNRSAAGVGVVTAGLSNRWVRTSGTSIASAVFTGRLLRTMGESGLDPVAALDALADASVLAPTTSDIAPQGLDPSTVVQNEAQGVVQKPMVEAVQQVEEPAVPVRATTLSTAPGYAADTFAGVPLVRRGSDPLDIRGDVDVLASVIASSRVQPPLSLGIFGDWGAGKSFLMNQVRLRVSELARASAAAATSDSKQDTYYCRRVAQIDFNAWQYAGGQLWASLINRVFEGIREHLGSDAAYAEVMRRIQKQDQHVQDAANRLKQAENALRNTADPASTRTAADVVKLDPALEEAVDRFASVVGVQKDVLALGEVAARTRELGTLAGRFREGWALRGTGGRAALAVVTVLGIAILALAAALPGVTRLLATVAGVVAPLSAVLLGILKPSGDALRAGVRILGREEEARQRYIALQAKLEAEQQELERLRHAGPAGLYGFVEDRYLADDYRKYLGMVPLIRQDLKQLSDQARQADAPIERIVLYIDDLDRCPTRQVVNVLEAVNLLFGFPGFVVVIAVDSRWLVRSLETEFSAVFGGDRANAPTPQDYMEKIIQIPFWLRRMQTNGFGRLVGTLLRPERDAQRLPRTPPAAHKPGQSSPAENTAQIVVESVDVESDDDRIEPKRPDAAGQPSEPPEAVDLTPDFLVVMDDELAFLERLAPLVGTPRAAKRLVNTYQLVRVSVGDVTAFLANAEYEPLLLLLALVAGSPGLSTPMAAALVSTSAADLGTFLQGLDRDSDEEGVRGWLRVVGALSEARVGSMPVARLRRWLPEVSRFSFRPGLADVANAEGARRTTS